MKMDSDTFFPRAFVSGSHSFGVCLAREAQENWIGVGDDFTKMFPNAALCFVRRWIHADASACGGSDEVHTFSTCLCCLRRTRKCGGSGRPLQTCVSLGGCVNEFRTFSYVEMDLGS